MQLNNIWYALSTLLTEHRKVVNELEQRLGVPLQDLRDVQGNLCFIEGEEVRPEYREFFNVSDVVYYFLGLADSSMLQRLENNNFQVEFPYPQNSEEFWRCVEKGKARSSR